MILTDAEVVAVVETFWERSAIWHLREACALSAEALAVDSFLAGEAGMAASMLQLNSLPRTDPSSHNTSLRPTVITLWVFCYLVLREEPDDLPSLWTLAVLNTLERGHFEVPIWERLASALSMGASIESAAQGFGGPWMVEWAGEVEMLLV